MRQDPHRLSTAFLVCDQQQIAFLDRKLHWLFARSLKVLRHLIMALRLLSETRPRYHVGRVCADVHGWHADGCAQFSMRLEPMSTTLMVTVGARSTSEVYNRKQLVSVSGW